jgi:fatty acid desaturase
MSDTDTDANAGYICNNPDMMLDGKDGGAIIDDTMNLTVDSDSSSVSSQYDTMTTNLEPVVLSKFIRIDGNVYDVTNFKHPGGNIINLVGNEDTTDRFNEYHFRSKKARSVLQSLPHVTDDEHNTKLLSGDIEIPLDHELTHREKEMTNDYRDMRRTLINNGCFDADYMHVYFRLMEIMFYFGLGSVLASHNMYASMLAFIVFKTRCGWLQHEAGHNSLTGFPKIDRLIQTVTIGFGSGLSATFWNTMHYKHHAWPQRIKHDIDLDTTPFVALFKTAFEDNTHGKIASKYKNRWWLRFQAWLFVPVVNGILVHMFWTYYLHPKKVIQSGLNLYTTKWIELFSMLAHHTAVPFIFWYYGGYSIISAYLMVIVCNMFTFMYMFGHFTLSHSTTGVTSESKSLLWFEYAIRHSVNISTKSAWISWIMGYLNFQIEHHLFPTMPQYKNAMAAPYVRAFCKKWNVPGDYDIQYKELTYFEAWKQMFTNLNEVGKHYFHNEGNDNHKVKSE